MLVNQKDYNELKRKVDIIESKLGNINSDFRGVVRSELSNSSVSISQASTLFGLVTALCVETIDIWKQNKIRYFSPLLHSPKTPIKALPWASPISAMGGFDDSGLNWVPPAGSTVCLIFENGNRQNAYYIGTTWSRNRGPENQHNWGITVQEYLRVSEGHRKGYLAGPNDESQVFPPWNTESYNGFDLNSVLDFADKPEVQKLITYPNIYGFKTPEKHMLKMVDGDPKCNRKWKRFELMSGCGNWIMLKDDHLHYAGQWSHPECPPPRADDDVSCIEDVSEQNPNEDITKIKGLNPFRGILEAIQKLREQLGDTSNEDARTTIFQQIESLENQLKEERKKITSVKDISPKDGQKKENTSCSAKIIGGHPDTGHPKSCHYKEQKGANPYFKHKNECRPYKGPKTPQNPTCDLPQSGIQIMSISGHTFVMDDSVCEPTGNPEWERSLEDFNFGCDNKFMGRSYWQSTTGHKIELSDLEKEPELRGRENYIRIKSATGNYIELNDETEPECKAGQHRGITMRSTSNHTFEMIDWENKHCSPRKEYKTPDEQNPESNAIPKAKKAFVKIRTGYGLEILMKDEDSQEETKTQHIKLFCPQIDNIERGPHIHQYQEAASGPGIVFLRVGGNYVISTYDNKVEIIGDPDENPSNKVEIISKTKLVYCKDVYINVTEKLHLFYAKELIALLAGSGSAGGSDGCNPGDMPAVGYVLIYDPCKGVIRLSTKVIGSYGKDDPCASIFMLQPFRKC